MAKKKKSPGCFTTIFVFILVMYVSNEILVADKNYNSKEAKEITKEVHKKLYYKSDTIPLK